jgi:F-type H+-transporting ATPase subunit delta
MNPTDDQSLHATLQEAARQRTVMDVGAQRIGKVYAEALLAAADKRNAAQEVLQEFDALIHDLFRRDPELETFFGSSAVGRDRKKALIEKALEGRAHEVFVNFLLVLNQHERLDMLRAIHAAYRELFDKRAGRIHVQVKSAVPLPADQAESLRQEIRAKFAKEPVLDIQVDPDLIAGMVVQIGDWKLDSSIQSRLRSIREQLLERSTYEVQSRRDRFRSPDGD